MLGNAAEFPLSHAGVPYRVQQSGLAMVYVTQDSNDRGAGDQARLVHYFGLFRILTGIRGVIFGHGGTDAERGGDQGGHLVIDDLVHRRHDSVAHQLLDDVDGILVGEFRQSLDGKGLRQYQNPGLPTPWLAGKSFSSHLLLHWDWVIYHTPVKRRYLGLTLRRHGNIQASFNTGLGNAPLPAGFRPADISAPARLFPCLVN